MKIEINVSGLDPLVDAIRSLAAVYTPHTQTAPDPADIVVTEEPAEPKAPAEKPKVEKPKVEKPKVEKPSVTIEDVKKATIAAFPGNTAGVAALIRSFGVSRVTEMGPEQWVPFLEKLEALDNG